MNSKNLLFKLNIKADESERIIFLLVQSLFIGIFISFYYSYANGLFVKTFSRSELPTAYIFSGLLGYIASMGFSRIHKKTSLSKIMVGLFLVLIFLLIFFKITISIYGDARFIVFLIFICFIPASTLTALSYGAMTIKFFDLRQGKRLFPLIGSGEVISSLIAFISIPVLLNVFNSNSDDTSFLLFFAITGALFALIFQLFIGKRFSHFFTEKNEFVKVEQKSITIKEIVKNKYFLSIVLLAFVSKISFMFIDYSFLSSSREFFSDKKTITAFLALLFAGIKFFEFVFKTFISGRLIEKYGLKFGLGILPVVLIPFAIFSLISLSFDTSVNKISNITFAFIAMNMLLTLVLRKSFEDPSFKLLFQPLNSNTKLPVQTLVSGKSSMLGIVLAGLILLLISTFESKIFITSSILLLFLIYWIIIISKVQINFKALINSLLKSKKSESISLESIEKDIDIPIVVLNKMNGDKKAEIFLRRLFPGYESNSVLKIKTQNDKLNAPVHTGKDMSFGNPVNHKVFDDININRICQNVLGNDVKQRAEGINVICKNHINPDDINAFLNQMINPEYNLGLYFLLYKSDNWVYTAKPIFENIDNSSMEKIRKKLATNAVFQLISNANDKSSSDFLNEKLRFSDSESELILLKGILKSGKKLDDKQTLFFKSKIYNEVSYYCRILACLLDLDDNFLGEEIQLYLNEELEIVKNKLFILLAIIYSKEDIYRIKDALDVGNNHEFILAIEMLEGLLEEELIPLLIPVFDNQEIKYKYEKLSVFYPQMRMNFSSRLNNIINYNFNRSNELIRIKAIMTLGEIKNTPVEGIVANLFNKNTLIKEAAFLTIQKIDNALFTKYFDLETDIKFKNSLKYILLENNENSVYQKFSLLSKNSFYPAIPKIELLRLAWFTEFNKDTIFETELLKNGDYVVFILEGEIKIKQVEGNNYSYSKGDSIGILNKVLTNDLAEIELSEDIKYLRILFSVFSEHVIVSSGLTKSILEFEKK